MMAPWKPLWSSRNIQFSTISRRPSPRSCLWSVRFSPRHGPRALQCREAFETRDAITIGGRDRGGRTPSRKSRFQSVRRCQQRSFKRVAPFGLTNEAAGGGASSRGEPPFTENALEMRSNHVKLHDFSNSAAFRAALARSPTWFEPNIPDNFANFRTSPCSTSNSSVYVPLPPWFL